MSLGCVCDSSVLLCVDLNLAPSRDADLVEAQPSLSLAVHRDLASRARSITTSDMCQVYYVRGFIELIYFVAVGFNQGQFMHTGWADGEVWGALVLEWVWLKSNSKCGVTQYCSERNRADEASWRVALHDN